MADLRDLLTQRNVLEARREAVIASLETENLRLSQGAPGAATAVRTLTAQLTRINQELTLVNQQIALVQNGTASSGQIVRNDDQATVSNASTQRPRAEPLIVDANGRVQPQPDTTSGTNATPAVTAESIDTGTNGELRPLVQTQATAQGQDGQGQDPLTDPSADGRPQAGGQNPGVGAASDDLGSGTNNVRVEIDNIFSETVITPRPNILDQYASYSYVASVYLCSPQSYRNIIETKQKNLNGARLLFQTGGVPVDQRATNDVFNTDYYIDRVNLKSKILGKGSNAAHNVYDMEITVVEPNGITLLENLDRAVQEYFATQGINQSNDFLDTNRLLGQTVSNFRGTPEQNKKVGFTQQIYLLVIRFYGYDENGNLVRGGVARPDGSSDPNAFSEKFYPFCLKNVKFRIANKLTEYVLECAPPLQLINSSTARGSIPYNIELGGQTLKDLLSGPVQYSSGQSAVTAGGNSATGRPTERESRTDYFGAGTAAEQLNADVWVNYVPPTTANNTGPSKADAAPTAKKTIRQGLMAALNQYQQDLVNAGVYTIADRYSVEFVNESLASAKIKKSGTTNKKATANNNTNNAADNKLGAKQSMDTNTRVVPATAGLQIVQFLDMAIRSSDYIEKQQIEIYDEVTKRMRRNGTPANNVAWYKITMQATPIGNAKDPKRNDYAYDIKFFVHAYKLADLVSSYFPQPKFIGVVKSYPYWFTGENTAVLSYEENFNNLYRVALSGINSGLTSNLNDLLKFNFSTRSNESSQLAEGKANEPPANAADFLYSPSDLKEVRMSIVGDPAWLQQGEGFAGFFTRNWQWGAFLPDGTINMDAQQVLFEVSFNTPRDYDMNTGLIDPNQGQSFLDNNTRLPNTAQQSRVYQAIEVHSSFNRGKFTQDLVGRLVTQSLTPQQVEQTTTQKEPVLSTSTGGFNSAGARLLQQREANAGFPYQAPKGVIANNRAADFLAERQVQITKPAATPQAPTSNGQSVAPTTTATTFSQDLANRQNARLNGVINNPQRIVKDQ